MFKNDLLSNQKKFLCFEWMLSAIDFRFPLSAVPNWWTITCRFLRPELIITFNEILMNSSKFINDTEARALERWKWFYGNGNRGDSTRRRYSPIRTSDIRMLKVIRHIANLIRVEWNEMQMVWPHFIPKMLDRSHRWLSLGKKWFRICREDIMEPIGTAYLANNLAHGQW